jgi:purine-binding chemotaxis protein CheW
MTRKRLEKQLETLFSDAETGDLESDLSLEDPSWQEALAGLSPALPAAEREAVKRAPESPLDPNEQRDMVTFRLNRQTYALPIEPLEQIIEMVTITPIPQLDGAVEGVINIRGRAVPVVNLRRHFGLPEVALQLRTPIILAQIDACTVGLIVDEVIDVLRLTGAQIKRTGDFLPEGLGAVPLLQGLAHTPEGTVLLLDLEHLFRPHERQVLAEVAGVVPGRAKEEELLECPVLPELVRRKQRPQAGRAAGTSIVEEMPLAEIEVEGVG